MTGDPYGWWCGHCNCRHGTSCCPNWGQYVAPLAAAGHCGKCGAPYTTDASAAFAPTKFTPTCKCWNI